MAESNGADATYSEHEREEELEHAGGEFALSTSVWLRRQLRVRWADLSVRAVSERAAQADTGADCTSSTDARAATT